MKGPRGGGGARRALGGHSGDRVVQGSAAANPADRSAEDGVSTVRRALITQVRAEGLRRKTPTLGTMCAQLPVIQPLWVS